MSPLVAALAFFALLPCVIGSQGGGLVFPMELGEVRCFYQDAKEENSKVFVHVTSLDGGYDMHVLINGPVQLDSEVEPTLGAGDIVFEGDLDKVHGEKKVLFRAQKPGYYQVCVGNKRQLAKLASVNIVAEDPTEQKVGPFRPMAPIKKTIIKISETLHSIKEEQAFLKTRERVHRETAKTTYQRVMMWSSLAIVLLISMGVGQVRYFYSLFGSSSTRSRGV